MAVYTVLSPTDVRDVETALLSKSFSPESLVDVLGKIKVWNRGDGVHIKGLEYICQNINSHFRSWLLRESRLHYDGEVRFESESCFIHLNTLYSLRTNGIPPEPSPTLWQRARTWLSQLWPQDGSHLLAELLQSRLNPIENDDSEYAEFLHSLSVYDWQKWELEYRPSGSFGAVAHEEGMLDGFLQISIGSGDYLGGRIRTDQYNPKTKRFETIWH
ncbi:hypothetical protein HY642_03335 [Candidatus Woesearchaeota archaeon]|nr:hypothetical protein [Candidatus Woesearchaeota archaeon]